MPKIKVSPDGLIVAVQLRDDATKYQCASHQGVSGQLTESDVADWTDVTPKGSNVGTTET